MALSNKAVTRLDYISKRFAAYISKRLHPITLFNLAALIIHNNTEDFAIFKYPAFHTLRSDLCRGYSHLATRY